MDQAPTLNKGNIVKTGIIVLTSIILVGACAWFINHNRTPRTMHEKAAAWCKKRIKELPPGDQNRNYFQMSLKDIENNRIRMDISEPSGLHHELLECWAKAWEAHSG